MCFDCNEKNPTWASVTDGIFLCIFKSIGFVGPGIALVGLIAAKSPLIASAWLTLAVGIKSFRIQLLWFSCEPLGMLNTAGTFAAIIGTIGASFFI